MNRDTAILSEIQKVVSLHDAGDMAEAAKAAQKFLDKHEKHHTSVKAAIIWARAESDNPMALYMMGKTYLFQGNFVEASKGFQLALQVKPDMAEAWGGLALCKYASGDLVPALECAEKAASINPRDITAQLSILDIYYNMGEFEKGLTRALELDKKFKNHPGVFMALARFNKELGEPERADLFYKKAIKFDPLNPLYHTGRLVLADERQDFDMIGKELPNVVALFENAPEKIRMMPSAWETVRTLNTLYDKNPISAASLGIILKTCDMDKDEPFSENLRAVDRSGDLHLFEAKDLKVFTTDTVYYDDVNCWMNHRYTGKAYKFTMATSKGNAYVVEQNEPIDLEKPGIYLSSVENYYHWLVDHLPRLGIIDQHPELAKLPIYVCEDITQTQRDSLAEIGIGSDRLILMQKWSNVRVKNGFVPYLPGRPMKEDGTPESWLLPVLNPFHYNWLRRKMVRVSPPNPSERLFLTREGAKFRRIINEDAIFAIAQKYGFRKVENSKLSFREQVDLYAGAEALIGPHGAAFTNQAFMKEGTTVFEMFPRHRHPPFYEIMAETKKQRYLHLDGPIVKTFKDLPPDFGDFWIDEKQFAKIMADNF
jgi:tetratricopeptide (TPR) repeat protein